MADIELVLAFEDRDALERTYREHMRLGRALLHTHARVAAEARVTLIVVHPETRAELRLSAAVLSARPAGELTRVALHLLDDAPEAIARIGGFVAELGPSADDESADSAGAQDKPGTESVGSDAEPAALACDDGAATEEGSDPLEGLADGATDAAAPSPRSERLRNLNEAQRMQVARGSVLEDRVVLERLYGPAVWPLLLHNPKITVAEVARMARKGTLPRPLLDVIADNDHWIRQSLVRRALLANPRLSPESAMRVLRATAPRELKLVPQQTAYPMSVRALAQRLLKGSVPRP